MNTRKRKHWKDGNSNINVKGGQMENMVVKEERRVIYDAWMAGSVTTNANCIYSYFLTDFWNWDLTYHFIIYEHKYRQDSYKFA